MTDRGWRVPKGALADARLMIDTEIRLVVLSACCGLGSGERPKRQPRKMVVDVVMEYWVLRTSWVKRMELSLPYR